MTVAALMVALVARQADSADAGVDDVEASRRVLETMRDQLRAVEHGAQEATGLGETGALECVSSGRLAIAHQLQSAEEWAAMLDDAAKSGDAELAARLRDRIAAAGRIVDQRISEVATCRLSVEPTPPAVNRSWFGCSDAPPVQTNPVWRGCERRRGSAVTFGIEGLLLAAPVVGLAMATGRGVQLPDYGNLALASLGGGVLGGLALFAVTGGLALALSDSFHDDSGKLGVIIGAATALGAGAGAITGMYLERPSSGAGAPIAAAATYVVLAGLSALLIAVLDHFSVASGDEPQSLAESTFSIAPALIALSVAISVPAAWSVGMGR